jgi:glycine cleavage system H protein
MVTVQDNDFPDHLLYDMDNQIWYEPLEDGSARAGFTTWAARLMGDVLVFTPKRLGRDFAKGRSFAVVEGGKWAGSARAAFDGTVVAHNERLEDEPELLNQDAFGEGWMLIVRPAREDWRDGLVTGAEIVSVFDAWMAKRAYTQRNTDH